MTGRLLRHVVGCLVAGLVALLPLGGAVFAVVWLDGALSGSWRRQLPFDFPGLGILLALLAVYAVGLVVSTVVGRWLWQGLDRLLERVPLLGALYQSLKEVLGYDTGRSRFVAGVVLVPGPSGHEVGLLMGEGPGPDGAPRPLVFLPGAPNPTNGRLVLADPAALVHLDARTVDAMRTLVSLGKSPLVAGRPTAPPA